MPPSAIILGAFIGLGEALISVLQVDNFRSNHSIEACIPVFTPVVHTLTVPIPTRT